MTYSCVVCGGMAVYFSDNKSYCIEHCPVVEQNIVAPIDSREYAEATDFPAILRRIKRLEEFAAERMADN